MEGFIEFPRFLFLLHPDLANAADATVEERDQWNHVSEKLMWVELCFGEAGEGEGREGGRTRPSRKDPRGQVTIHSMKCSP